MAQNRLIHFFLIALIILASGGAFFFFKSKAVDIAEEPDEYLCLRDKEPPQHDIVLVDGTDTLSPANIRGTRRLINDEILERLPRNGRLTIISFTGDEPSFMNALFTSCNPGRGEDVNELYENKKRAYSKWRREFINVLDGFLRKLEKIPTASSTPLLEMLEILSEDPDFSPDIEKRRIFIVSDLLQSHNGVSFYKSDLNFENEIKKSYFTNLEIDLNDVDVIIYQIERPNTPKHTYTNYQGKKQRELWEGLLTTWGAEDVKFHRPSRLQPINPIIPETTDN